MRKLNSWPPGVSGNPNGRPKGSRNLKTIIRDMLDSMDTYQLLPENYPRDKGTPLEAIVCALTVKAMEGDTKAADTLLKYAIDRDDPVDEPTGFFSRPTELTIKVVDSHGDPYVNEELKLPEEPKPIEHQFVADMPVDE